MGNSASTHTNANSKEEEKKWISLDLLEREKATLREWMTQELDRVKDEHKKDLEAIRSGFHASLTKAKEEFAAALEAQTKALEMHLKDIDSKLPKKRVAARDLGFETDYMPPEGGQH